MFKNILKLLTYEEDKCPYATNPKAIYREKKKDFINDKIFKLMFFYNCFSKILITIYFSIYLYNIFFSI